MSAIVSNLTRNPVGFATEMAYMFAAMLATNVALECVDESFIERALPAQTQQYAKLVTASVKDALQFKISQFY